MKALDRATPAGCPYGAESGTLGDTIWQHVAFIVELVAASLIGALLEVQIEGEDGWAATLPTWTVGTPAWARRLLGARSITGYHVYVQLFMVVVMHAPYALGFATPSLHAELRILAFLVLFWVVEDFLWFVVNPAFGIRRFRRGEIWWHAATWWGFMPRDYWIGLPLGIGLYILSG